MFELAVLEDSAHLAPTEFGKPRVAAATDVILEKYANKVVPDVGLCIALFDILEVGESQLHQGSAHQHARIRFRLVIFRPFHGEILVGTILSCDQAGVRLSLGFFDEIYVPKELLIEDTSWSSEEELWVWNATDTDQLFFDLDNTARFRVAQVSFRRNAAAPPPASKKERLEPAMQITAAMDKEGLGLLTWWPADEEEEGGGEEGGEGG